VSPISLPPEGCFGRASPTRGSSPRGTPTSPLSPRKPKLKTGSLGNFSEDMVQILHSNPEEESDLGSSVSVDQPAVAASSYGMARRLARNDRPDTKRYYTAGVIEDIKVCELQNCQSTFMYVCVSY